MKKLIMFLCAVTLILGAMSSARATVFLSDDFNRPNSTTVGTFWTEEVPGANIYNEKLFLKNGGFLYTDPIVTTGYSGITMVFDWRAQATPEHGHTLDIYWGTGDIEVSKSFVTSIDLTSYTEKKAMITLSDWSNLASLQFGFISTTDNNLEKAVIDDFEVIPNPEPATVMLMGIGIAGIIGAGARKRFKKKAVDNS